MAGASSYKRIQDFDDSSRRGDKGISLVRDFLSHTGPRKLWLPTEFVHDVQNEPEFQTRGIDLLCLVKAHFALCAVTVEVKADTLSRTGNLFIETVSDIERNAPGAFFASQAEWYFYCFTDIEVLYCLPMPLVKPWFKENIERFKERQSNSSRSGRSWSTLGRLVPRHILFEEVPDIHVYERKMAKWVKAELSIFESRSELDDIRF